jgi:hypothetical protein
LNRTPLSGVTKLFKLGFHRIGTGTGTSPFANWKNKFFQSRSKVKQVLKIFRTGTGIGTGFFR